MSVRTPPAPVPRVLKRALGHGIALVQGVAFWLAVVLPVAYLPLFVALKYAYLAPGTVVGVLGLNGLALLLGHRHEPGRYAGGYLRWKGSQ